jgi:hypothetical protein
MNTIQWAHPLYLTLLLVALPLLWALWYLGMRLRTFNRQQYADEGLARRFMRNLGIPGEALQIVLWTGLLSMLLVTAAGPVKPNIPEKIPAGTMQAVLVLDTSDSMACEDYRPFMRTAKGEPGESVVGPFGNRLDAAKKIITEQIMPGIEHNQLGVVIFSGDGRPFWEVSDDFSPVRYILRYWMRAGAGPGFGSNVAEGLTAACEMLDRDKLERERQGDFTEKQQVIIVFSDGGFSSKPSDLANATQELVKRKIHVIVVGVGLNDAMPIPQYMEHPDTGELIFLGDKRSSKDSNQLIMGLFDEPSLQSLATDAQGEYHRIGSDMKLNIKWTNTLPNVRPELAKTPLYHYPLAAALLFLLAISVSGLWRKDDLI